MLNSVAPFFIVDDLGATLAFYQSKLGFAVLYKCGGEGNGDDYFAIMGRDRVMLMFKAITPEVHPQPNRSRHEWARWDAYIGTDDPDSLYTEFIGREVPVHRDLANTSDGLRAFEITDNSGYVLCFGRPVDKQPHRRKVVNPVFSVIFNLRKWKPLLDPAFWPGPGNRMGHHDFYSDSVE